MHALSSGASRSPQPEISQWIFEPPSSSAVMSSPTTAFTSGGPPSALLLVPFTIGTKSASAAPPRDPGPGRVDEPDHREALRVGDLARPVALDLRGSPHRARHHGEVVGDHRRRAPADPAEAGDDTVGGRLPAG